MRTRRLLAAVGIVATGVTFDLVPAAASTDGACPTAEGVTVVVDFQELGGGVAVRCATGNLPTGFAALDAAGVDYQTTVRFSGFLCKIAGLPTNDPCINASPATAYWSYWLAPRGGQWCYSHWGAGNRTPPPGTVEGWSFSMNRNASTSPSPRLPVPAAVPGSPTSLPANDCDQSPSAPKPPATNPPATSSPATVPPASTPAATNQPAVNGPGSTPIPTTGSPTARAGSTATTVPSVAQSETTTAEALAPPGDTTTAPDSLTPLPADTMSTDPRSSRTSTTTLSIDDAELAGSIDLGGGSDDGSPVGVIVAGALVVVLGRAAVAFRRRHRS